MIHIASHRTANDSIPSNNQRVNDFKDLAQLDGIKIAYDLIAEENLNREMILCSQYGLSALRKGSRRQFKFLLNIDWRL